MSKIDEKEENEMYKIISDALFSLCENKPKNPIKYLSAKMLELIGDNPDSLKIRHKSNKLSMKKSEQLYLTTSDKLDYKSYTKSFDNYYTIVKKIGQGYYGFVYLAHTITNEENKKIVKIIDLREYSDINLSEIKISSLLKLDHLNLTKLYDIIIDEYNLYVVEEFCKKGTLLNYLINHKEFVNAAFIKNVIKSTLASIAYIHKKGLVHRHITAENILIDEEKDEIIVKINDYLNISERLIYPAFSSPELIRGIYDHKCDIWSLGVVYYIMCTGIPPFDGDGFKTISEVLTKPINYDLIQIEGLKDLIRDMTDMNPFKRPEATTCLNYPYLTQREDLDKSTDVSFALGALTQLSNFVAGKQLRRTILNYIMSRKLYEENNIQLLKLFQEIDVNNDGQIDQEELFAKYGKYFPGTQVEEVEHVKKLISTVDINNTGTITYSEFLVIFSDLNKEINKKMLKEVFDYFDQDKSGFIDAHDLKAIFEDSDIPDTKFQDMIDEFDQNGDRKLSLEEFYDLITKYY